MNADPLGPVARAFEDAAGRLRRATEGGREDWNDEARRTYDARYGSVVDAETAAVVRGVEEARQTLRRAMAAL